MKKYICNECNEIFNEPRERQSTYENYYGVSHLFHNSHMLTYHVCPCCGSEDYEEIKVVHDSEIKISNIVSHQDGRISFQYAFADVDEECYEGNICIESTQKCSPKELAKYVASIADEIVEGEYFRS